MSIGTNCDGQDKVLMSLRSAERLDFLPRCRFPYFDGFIKASRDDVLAVRRECNRVNRFRMSLEGGHQALGPGGIASGKRHYYQTGQQDHEGKGKSDSRITRPYMGCRHDTSSGGKKVLDGEQCGRDGAGIV